MKHFIMALAFLCCLCVAQATNYYVTQSTAGTGSGTSLGNAKSIANHNTGQTFAGASPTGGDTIIYSGTFTTAITVVWSGTGNGASRLTMDLSGATLNVSGTRITCTGKSFIDISSPGADFQRGAMTIGATFGTGSYSCIDFGSGSTSHDITVSGFYYVGASQGTGSVAGGNCYNLIIENCYADNIGNFYWDDGTESHHLTIRNNWMRSSGTTTASNPNDQIDLIAWGDAHDVTIEGNKIIQRDQSNATTRHNDCIQWYHGGSNGGANPNPYNIVIRYNWVELDVPSGSGDNSWIMGENATNTNGTFALKAYRNVFVGKLNTVGNNGFCINSSNTPATYHVMQNTFIRRGGPDNTLRMLNGGTSNRSGNLMYDPSGGGGTYFADNMTAGTITKNFAYNSGSVSGYAGTGGSTSTNPLLNDQASHEYWLGSSSTLLNSGDSTIDSEYNQGIKPGTAWPGPELVTAVAGSWNVGAYQREASDVTAPTISTIAINSGGTTATVTFTEAVSNGAGGSAGWTISPSSGAATMTYASGTGTSTWTMNLSRTIYQGETGTSGYTQPGNGAEDAAGNDLATASGVTVTNNSTQNVASPAQARIRRGTPGSGF